MSTSIQPTLGVIGNGNMAMAIIGGLIKMGTDPATIWVSGPNAEKLAFQQKTYGFSVTTDNTQYLRQTRTLILAVKPSIMPVVCRELSVFFEKQKDNIINPPLFISIAAGITTKQIQKWLRLTCAIIRAMPNTPSLLQAGATGLYANEYANQEDRQHTEQLLVGIGLIQWLQNENQIDIVTALSGSGPAYFYYIIESMIEAGINLGLDEQTSTLLTIQTAYGASLMAKANPKDIKNLRLQVTSKGGTTESATQVFEMRSLKSIFKEAIEKANKRSIEQSQMENENE